LLGIVLSVILFVVLSTGAQGISNNPCSPCHPIPYGDFDQYLDILEIDSRTQIPTSINKDETLTISLAIENKGNPGIYETISSVSLQLNSKYDYFSVNSETYYIGDMPLGKEFAEWQITGRSDGYDTILIRATGINEHGFSQFSDSYSVPITVGSPTSSPTPTPTPTISPIPPQTTPPTSTPKPTVTPTPTPTPEPPSTPTPEPTNSPSPLTSPTQTPLATPTPESSTFPNIFKIMLIIAAATIMAILVYFRNNIIKKKRMENHNR